MIERLATFAMGTRFEMVLAGDDPRRLRSVGEAVIDEIEDLDRRWSLFRRDSLLSFINRHGADRPVRVDADTFAVLSIAERVRRESAGLFDITVATAMRRWGFHGQEFTTETQRTQREDEESGARDQQVSSPGSPRRALCLCGESSSVSFSRRGVAIDLGGIAKGYAVDRALRILREHGTCCAIIHGGTSCVGAIGAPPGEEGWRIAIESPAGGERPVVTLRDSCLAVSSPAGREVEAGGRRLGHIIDPRTGAPAECARVACVIGPGAALCDAWTKPVLIGGERPEGLPDDSTTVVDSARDGPAQWVVDGPGVSGVFVQGTRLEAGARAGGIRGFAPRTPLRSPRRLFDLGVRDQNIPAPGCYAERPA